MRKFKIPSSFTIIFALIAFFALLSWILPPGEFKREGSNESIRIESFKRVSPTPQGIIAVLKSFSKGIENAVGIIAFLLIVGGSYGVILKTGAINAGIKSIIERLKNKISLLIPILMFLLGVCGSTIGIWEEVLPFNLIMIPLFLSLGYDKITPVALLIVGAGFGNLASTINPFATGISSSIAKVSLRDGIYWRVALFFLSFIISTIYVTIHAKMSLKGIKKDLKKDKNEGEKAILSDFNERKVANNFTFKMKIIVALFGLSLFLMIFGIVKFKWDLDDIAVIFLSLSLLSAIIVKMSEEVFINAFIDGAKELLPATLMIGLARGIIIVAQDGKIIDSLLYSTYILLSQLPEWTFILLNQVFQSIVAFFVPSSSGQASLTTSLSSSLADLMNVKRAVIVSSIATSSGLINLFAPTSAVLMSSLKIANIKYSEWFKFIMPLILMQYILIQIILLMQNYF